MYIYENIITVIVGCVLTTRKCCDSEVCMDIVIFSKNVERCRDGSAKTTQTRYMDGSVQRTTQVTPSLHLFFFFVFCTKMFPVILQQSLDTRSFKKKTM